MQPDAVLKMEMAKLNREYADVKDDQKDLQGFYQASIPDCLKENSYQLEIEDFAHFKNKHL